jgi:uncharacterized membrane protein YwaF
MIGSIIVSVFAASLIVVYMLIVNRFLRADEHYYSQDPTPAEQETERAVNLSTKHAHA